jgi:RsiW-degrading membrane proteinase PrsW (M82 family)
MSNVIRAIYFAIWFVIVLVSYALLGVLPALANALWFAAFYLLLTLPVRTVRVLTFAVFFFVGLLIVSHATLILQIIVGVVLPPMYSNTGKFVHLVLLAPITEETAKFFSIALVLLIWKLTGARIAFGATDLMLVGLAIGIGLNVFEDMFIANAKIQTPGIVTNILVPWSELQVTRGRPDIVFIGHAASTAFIALALGWSRYLPKLVRYLPALGVWVWMIWTHALYNGQDLLDRGHVVFFTAPLSWITPYVFFLAVLATIGFEFVVLRYRVTNLEKNFGERRAQGWTRWLEKDNLQRHLAYARVWLRGNAHDREKVSRYLTRVVARLERAMA